MAWKDIAVLLQRGPEKGFAVEEFVYSDRDVRVQEHAVFALIAIVKGK